MMVTHRRRLVTTLLAAFVLMLPVPAIAQQGRPSARFRAELRRTLEKRRQLRTSRTGIRPPNAIVPWLMPPALIIRATPDVHDEIQSLLGTLRKYP